MVLWRSKRTGFLNPSYNELSVSMMNLSFLLVFLFTEKLRGDFVLLVSGFESGRDIAFLVVLLLFLGAFFLLPFYHLLTKRKMKSFEKRIMLVLAMLANAGGGTLASMHVLGQSLGAPSVLVILPIWNICNCLMLVGLWEQGAIGEDNVTEATAGAGEILVCLIGIVGVFALCRFVFELYWALTFSICVICATSFAERVGDVFHRGQEVSTEDAAGARGFEKREGSVAIESRYEKKKKAVKCGVCERMLLRSEKPWVINKKLVVCKECYDKIQGARE
jgi:hypothetical protein